MDPKRVPPHTRAHQADAPRQQRSLFPHDVQRPQNRRLRGDLRRVSPGCPLRRVSQTRVPLFSRTGALLVLKAECFGGLSLGCGSSKLRCWMWGSNSSVFREEAPGFEFPPNGGSRLGGGVSGQTVSQPLPPASMRGSCLLPHIMHRSHSASS